ncbi:MAG: cyclic nucleotide-binding domain-containing protein [Leptolyngbyaceae cyanobacterium MO_188.B28]|nr:cyclic nucleotide-binding domain-containing protein [Leptolyngbyaceae cyanobacterium MO_188.B28]
MKKTLYLLAELSDRDFEWLIQVGKLYEIPTGGVLIHEGEPINALYLVLKGVLSVFVGALHDQEVAQLNRGEVVGEISFVDSRPPTATVKAAEDSIVWAIPRIELVRKMQQDVAFAAHFYHALAIFLADRLRATVSQPEFEEDSSTGQNEAVNPEIEGVIELAQLRLNWLLKHLNIEH